MKGNLWVNKKPIEGFFLIRSEVSVLILERADTAAGEVGFVEMNFLLTKVREITRGAGQSQSLIDKTLICVWGGGRRGVGGAKAATLTD